VSALSHTKCDVPLVTRDGLALLLWDVAQLERGWDTRCLERHPSYELAL
jgi:hypothetical protein